MQLRAALAFEEAKTAHVLGSQGTQQSDVNFNWQIAQLKAQTAVEKVKLWRRGLLGDPQKSGLNEISAEPELVSPARELVQKSSVRVGEATPVVQQPLRVPVATEEVVNFRETVVPAAVKFPAGKR